jgi:hypothetical protein
MLDLQQLYFLPSQRWSIVGALNDQISRTACTLASSIYTDANLFDRPLLWQTNDERTRVLPLVQPGSRIHLRSVPALRIRDGRPQMTELWTYPVARLEPYCPIAGGVVERLLPELHWAQTGGGAALRAA